MGNRLLFLYQGLTVMSDGVTQKVRSAQRWSSAFKPVGRFVSEMRQTVTLRGDDESVFG